MPKIISIESTANGGTNYFYEAYKASGEDPHPNMPPRYPTYKELVEQSGVKNNALDTSALVDQIHKRLSDNLDEALRAAVNFHLGHDQWEPEQITDRCKLTETDYGVEVFSMDDVDLLKIHRDNPYLYNDRVQRHLAKFSQRIVILY